MQECFAAGTWDFRGGLDSKTHRSPPHSSGLAIDTLSSRQRAHLRALAHSLKPLLHVGKEGVNDATVSAARDAFNTRELMKIRVLENAPAPPGDAARSLAGQLEGAHVVQVIGRTAVLYRRDPERPRIELP